MAFSGTVVNGVIVLEGGMRLPEGVQVQVELDDLAPPLEPYDREMELAILRESLEDVKAGRTVPARQALADIAREFGLPSSRVDESYGLIGWTGDPFILRKIAEEDEFGVLDRVPGIKRFEPV